MDRPVILIRLPFAGPAPTGAGARRTTWMLLSWRSSCRIPKR